MWIEAKTNLWSLDSHYKS